MALKQIFLGMALSLLAMAAGAAAPGIELRDLEGKPRNVNEFIGQGKWTVVAVWAHDCKVCAEEIGEMRALHAARGAKDITVLGVSIDGSRQMAQARGFVALHKLPFTNLVAEPEQEVMARFGGGAFIGTPTFYIYEPGGKIVARRVGPLASRDAEEFIAAFNDSPYAKKQSEGK